MLLLNSVCVWFVSASSGLFSKSLNEWVCSFEAYLSSWLCVFRDIVEGVIPHETGTIDAPIGRDINNRQKMAVTSVNGKDSITHFRVLERFSKYTLIECTLETGRTHQIRVHMAYIGYPIVNDPVYGRSKNTTEYGQYLHSKSIRFIHPITKKEIYFETDMPLEFKEFLGI